MFGGVLTAPREDGPDPGDRLARAAARLDDAQVASLADLAEAFATDPTSLTGTEQLAGAIAFDQVRNRFDAANHRLHAALDDSLAYAIDGSRSPSAWLNANTCVSSKTAGIGLALSRKLRGGFPAVNESFSSGRIGVAKVRLLVKARRPDLETYFDWMEPMLVAEVEPRTVEAATLFLLSWRYRLLELLAQNDLDVDPDPQGETSHLHLSRILDGRLVLDGELDAEDAAIVMGAIDAKIDSWFQAGLLTGDTRSRAELQAAALVELVRDGASPTKPGGALRPLFIAVVDADTLAERADQARQTRARIQAREHGDGAGGDPEGFDWHDDPDGPEPGIDHPRGSVGSRPEAPRPHPRRSDRGPANRSDRPGRTGSSSGSGPPARFDHSDLDHLAQRLGLYRAPPNPRSPNGSPHGPAHGAAPRMVFRSEIVGSGPVPPETIERILCTADICRVVTRGGSEILDVGRTHRLATAAQRRALVIRSGGICEWPGCSTPHSWCDAHHLDPWDNGGHTNMDNLAQVCNHHHRQFHQAGYIGIIETDGLHVYRRDGTEVTTLLDTRS